MTANYDVRALALSLHTDLKTMDDYAKEPTIVEALVGLARTKIATINAHLDMLRDAANTQIVA